MKIKFTLLTLFLALLLASVGEAQMMYYGTKQQGLSIGTYGRIGVDWSFDYSGSIGRRLNLNNMGSIGGRMEEQDYLEVIPAAYLKPFKNDDPTIIKIQSRLSVFSQSLSLFGNSSSVSPGGLAFALPEMYAEASNINGKDLNIWIGARMYLHSYANTPDHFYFDDHTGQGFGIEYKNSRFAFMFVATTDTTSTVPPYFYLSIGTGTPGLALRQRTVLIVEHDFMLSEKQKLTALFEYHKMASPEGELVKLPVGDTAELILNYPADYGLVFGAKLESKFGDPAKNNYNRFSIRYGSRIANGGDGGMSRTFNTFGAHDEEEYDFSGAYSLSIVNDMTVLLSKNNSLNGYVVYTNSKGGSDSDGKAKTFYNKEVYNKKHDFTIGFSDTHFISDKFHLISELHYSQRKDGKDDTYSYSKLSLAPTFVPSGKRSAQARPHFRFVASLAHYNDAARDNQYSPYLAVAGKKSWGSYFGIKAEWWY